MLAIKNLTKRYGNKSLFKNLFLTFPSGSITLILGSSGTGKSTLLRLLNGLEKPDEGEIFLFDQNLSQAKNQITLVFQEFHLFEHLNAKKNLTLVLEKIKGKNKAQSQQAADQLLKKYELFSQANNSVKQLSGGQKQRLAIARALALAPKIICFDEPTSALDPKLTAQVAKYLQELANEGYTLIITTHDTSLLAKIDARIVLIGDGKILQVTNTREFLASPDRFPILQSFL